MTEKEYHRFSRGLKNSTGFDAMAKQDDETYLESARKNVTWLRDWAEETAQDLEKTYRLNRVED